MTATDTGREVLVTRARLAKAQKLAAVLVAHGATGAQVHLLPPGSRRTVEQLAGVPESSDVTWAMAADLVAARRTLDARVAAGTFDPFEGLA